MKITYNAEGTKRKELVNAVSKLLAVDSVYQGPPSFAYTVDGYTIDRHGNLQTPEEATRDDIFLLTDALFAEYGFKAEEHFDELFPDEVESDEDEDESKDTSDAAEPNEQDDAEEAESVDEEDDEDEDTDSVCDSESDEDDEVDADDPIEEEVADEAEQDEGTDDADDITEEETDDSDEESIAEASEESEDDSVDAPETAPVAAKTVSPEDDTEEAAKALENGVSAPETGEDPADPEAPPRLTLSLPREKFSPSAIERLRALVMSKQTLLKKVFETDDLSIETNDTQIMFPWFTLHGIDGETDAYAKFVHAIAVRALTSSRISSYEKPTDNDKFTMRLFLNNLGFKGEEYKFARRFLVRNLEGNGAWRYGNAPDASNVDLDLPTVFTPAAPVQEANVQTEDDVEALPEEADVGDEEESTDEE